MNLVEPPEVIANPPLGNLRLIYSTPVYKEWKNGNLLRHTRAVLSQHLPEGSSIESNYVLNIGEWGGDLRLTGDMEVKKADIEEERQAALDFIKKIVEVQKLALSSRVDSVAQQNLQQIIENENDPLVKDVLRLAKERADQIAISAVNIKDTVQLIGMNYTTGSYIASVRSVGMDYAYKKLKDEDAVFLMNDVDTVPGTNKFIQDLLKVYSESPEIKYVFLGMAYLPPGENKDLVSNSLHESGIRTVSYNRQPAGSPQISFRKSAMEAMQGIATGKEHDEDYETASRLINFFGGIQNGLLMQNVLFIPTHLTTERSTGFVDGAGRATGIRLFVDTFNQTVVDMWSMYSSLEERAVARKDLQAIQALQELAVVRKAYHRQQRLLLRFNKLTAVSFLNNLDLGNIVIENGEVKVDEQTILQEGKNAFARPLLTFVRANKELVASLSAEDLALMKYYVLGGEFPPSIKTLSPFQSALREYLGEFPKKSFEESFVSLKFGFGDLASLYFRRAGGDKERGLTDKTTIYQPFVADTLALGSLTSRFFKAGESDDRENSIGMEKNLADRSAWLDTALPKAEVPQSTDQMADLRFNRFIARFMPFGFLAQFFSKRNKK